jgi:tRNA G46 methylase TrmB
MKDKKIKEILEKNGYIICVTDNKDLYGFLAVDENEGTIYEIKILNEKKSYIENELEEEDNIEDLEIN